MIKSLFSSVPAAFSLLFGLIMWGACARVNVDIETHRPTLIPNQAGENDPAYPRVFFNNPKTLIETRRKARLGDASVIPALEKLRDEANQALQSEIYTVMAKPFTPPSGDKHDYMSVGPYWWPNPDTPDSLPYIRKDGQVNPERDSYDRMPLWKLERDVTTLAVAYYFLDHDLYAVRAGELIRAWFLNEDTRMNPNLNFAQAIPGRTKGRGAGIIDSRAFFRITEAVGLIGASPSWIESDEHQLQTWFKSYLVWMLESANGKNEAAKKNNHGTWFDVIAADLALYTGQDELARKILAAVPDRRINSQIKSDGSQPLELARTRSYHYSVMNLKGLFCAALLGEKVGLDLLDISSEHGQLIKKALDYLLPHIVDNQIWPYQQLRGWEVEDSESMAMMLKLAATYFNDPSYQKLLILIPEIDLNSHRINLLLPI